MVEGPNDLMLRTSPNLENKLKEQEKIKIAKNGLFKLKTPKNTDIVYASTAQYPEKAFSFGTN
jgi:hypothetical protein